MTCTISLKNTFLEFSLGSQMQERRVSPRFITTTETGTAAITAVVTETAVTA